jgi:hypothetical protein
LFEKDPKRIAEAVRLAEETIEARFLEMVALDDRRNRSEQADLNTALRDLIPLKAKYRLSWLRTGAQA